MVTIILKGSNLCAGGGHFDLDVTGDISFSDNIHVNEVKEPVTIKDKEVFIRLLLRLYAKGKTKAQIKQGLAAGVRMDI